MSDATLSLVVLGATVALFVWNRLSVGVLAILCALALFATGLVDLTRRRIIDVIPGNRADDLGRWLDAQTGVVVP